VSLVHGIGTRFMILHENLNNDGIRSFFQEVNELYVKVKAYFKSVTLVVLHESHVSPLHTPHSACI
jgi:hypothetical protein